MTLDNMTGITKGSYTGGDLFCKSQLITCNRVKECNGVCPFEDALKHADQAVKAIKSLPYAEPKTGWIPVSERLPEDTTKPVLISGNHKGLGVYAVDIARYNGGMWQYDGFTFPDCDILAWMPVPEPYKGEGEEHETD